jgi:hypothetical protein
MPPSEFGFALEFADVADSLSLRRFRALDLRIGVRVVLRCTQPVQMPLDVPTQLDSPSPVVYSY